MDGARSAFILIRKNQYWGVLGDTCSCLAYAKQQVASSNINIYDGKSTCFGPASWPPDVPAESLEARNPQPGVLSQPSSARSPQQGFLSQKISVRNSQPGVLSQESSAKSPQPGFLSQESSASSLQSVWGPRWSHSSLEMDFLT